MLRIPGEAPAGELEYLRAAFEADSGEFLGERSFKSAVIPSN